MQCWGFARGSRDSEFEFGTNPNPGSLVRETHRAYATDILLNGYCYTNLNARAGSCTSAPSTNPDDIVHIRRLMLSEEIKTATGVREAYAEFSYDNYSADGNNTPLTIHSGMIQYDGARFGLFSPQSEPRGNPTREARWLTSSTFSTSFSRYDNPSFE